MGYLTRYILTIEDAGPYSEEIIIKYMKTEWVAADLAEDYWEEETGTFGDTLKWYDHDSDMWELSDKFPRAVFKLHGEGEESGDIWTNWYKNGKSHRWTPVIKEPDFDPTWFK